MKTRPRVLRIGDSQAKQIHTQTHTCIQRSARPTRYRLMACTSERTGQSRCSRGAPGTNTIIIIAARARQWRVCSRPERPAARREVFTNDCVCPSNMLCACACMTNRVVSRRQLWGVCNQLKLIISGTQTSELSALPGSDTLLMPGRGTLRHIYEYGWNIWSARAYATALLQLKPLTRYDNAAMCW